MECKADKCHGARVSTGAAAVPSGRDLLARHPWWGQKLAERKDAVQCVRAAEGYRGRDVRPRSFAQTGNCVAVGPREDRSVRKAARAFRSSLAVDGRGETRLSQKGHGSPPRAGFPAEPWDFGERLPSEKDIGQGRVFHAQNPSPPLFLASCSRLQQRHLLQQQQQRSNSA